MMKKRSALHSLAIGLLLIAATLNFSSCAKDEVQTTYSTYRAFFRYGYVTTALPLYAAVNGAGQYCLVYMQNSYLHFQSLTNQQQVNITALGQYQSFTSINGFIIGRTNIPDMNTQELIVLCFDRACPNCFKSDNVTRSLTLKENGEAYCSRCKRTYDLNNLGIIKSGDPGIKLFRYAVTYNGTNILIVQN